MYGLPRMAAVQGLNPFNGESCESGIVDVFAALNTNKQTLSKITLDSQMSVAGTVSI